MALGGKLQDALPGTWWRDADNDLWERTSTGARMFCLLKMLPWNEDELNAADENFGPFTPCLATPSAGRKGASC